MKTPLLTILAFRLVRTPAERCEEFGGVLHLAPVCRSNRNLAS